MINALVDQLRPLQLRPPADEDAIRAAEQAIGRALPEDYKCFLRRTNGFEGWTPGQLTYLRLSIIEELPKYQSWGGEWSRPAVVWFGSDGGGDGYFFDYETPGPAVLMIGYISDWKADALWHGDSFTDFLERIVQGWDPFHGPGARHA